MGHFWGVKTGPKRALFGPFSGDRGPEKSDQTYFFCTEPTLIAIPDPSIPNRKIHLLEGHREGTSCGPPPAGGEFRGNPGFWTKSGLKFTPGGVPRGPAGGSGGVGVPGGGLEGSWDPQGGPRGGPNWLRIPLFQEFLSHPETWGNTQTGNWPFPGDTRSRVRGQIVLGEDKPKILMNRITWNYLCGFKLYYSKIFMVII